MGNNGKICPLRPHREQEERDLDQQDSFTPDQVPLTLPGNGVGCAVAQSQLQLAQSWVATHPEALGHKPCDSLVAHLRFPLLVAYLMWLQM